MWILVIFMVVPYGGAITSVPGFMSELSCRLAAKEVRQQFDTTLKDAHVICLKA